MAHLPADTLRNRTFIGLLIAQFLAAFNDQAIHASAMFFAINQKVMTDAQAITLMPILFYAPWALFVTLAGYYADRFSKRNVLIFWKLVEIGIMLFAYHQHVPLTAALSRNDEILPRFIITSLPHGAIGFIVAAIVAAALSPSLNAMAATTVNDFYLKYVRPDADQATLMRLSRQATYGWGIVQLAVALGAQWMRQSVLDAGLSVLSLTTGPVLGAFMVGVLTRHVGSRAMLGGMAAGAIMMAAIWSTGALAWTWWALAGAATTSGVALLLALFPAFRTAPGGPVAAA